MINTNYQAMWEDINHLAATVEQVSNLTHSLREIERRHTIAEIVVLLSAGSTDTPAHVTYMCSSCGHIHRSPVTYCAGCGIKLVEME